MLLLLLGLVLFLGAHSSRFLLAGFRGRVIESRGENVWKGGYALVSLAGLVLIWVGYAQARLAPTVLWVPPSFLTPVVWLLTLVAFVLLVATYVPNNRIKSAVNHPMVLAVKVWAVSHLLVNGTLAALLLFGSFLVWAVVDFASSRRRDRAEGIVREGGALAATLTTVGVGAVLWLVFFGWAHYALIGVRPFG